ncbi:MAG: MFS transporter [Nitrospirae bacterium]|nr:MFS transporter [Nitrospirota bacterium]
MKMEQPLLSLRHKNFRIFWFGQIVSLTGTWMHSVGQGWLVLKLTDSPFYLGLVGTAGSLPILLFTLFGGIAADRFPKRDILITTQISSMFLALTLAILTSTGIVNVWHVLILTAILGTVHAFDVPTRQSFIIEMVGRESLLNAIALNSAAFNGARIIGPAIAGLAIGYLSLEACFYINALSFLAVIIALGKMRFDPSTSSGLKEKTSKIKEEMVEGLRYISGESRIYVLIIFVAIISFFGFPYITFLPVFARDILQVGPTGLGLLMSSAGAGAFIGAMGLALRGDVQKKGLLSVSAGIIFSLALIVFSFSKVMWLSSAMLVLTGWGALTHLATANSLIQLVAPDHLRGRVMSAYTLFFLGMTPIGNFVVGTLAHYVGTGIAIAIGAKLCLLGTILLIWKKPEILKI